MLNGRNHPAAGKSLMVNGKAGPARAEADTSDLYGEYEQKLAVELAELLRNGSGATPAGAVAALAQMPRAAAAGLNAAATRQVAGRENAYSPSAATALEQAAPGRPRAVVPAGRPRNDFAAGDDNDPLPFSWRHESRPSKPSWVSRQLKAGLLGLSAGLVIVLPAVAVFSGKLDPWLPRQQTASLEVPVQKALVQPAEPRLFDVARVRPEPIPSSPAVVVAPATLPAAKPVAAPVAEPVAAAAVVAVAPPVVPSAPPTDPAIMSARSVGTTEAFPPAAAPVVVAPPVPPDAAELLAQGLKLVKAGDVAGARTPLAKAANTGNAEAMMALAETFDPNMLAAWGARDVKSDASTARLFYARAHAAGLTRAKGRLDALN